MVYYPRNRRNVKSKRKVTKSKSVRKPKGVFKKKVQAVIRSMAEDKTAYTSLDESTLVTFNSAINNTAEILQIVPNIAEGSAENQRIGDRIKPTSLTISGYIRFNPVLTGNINPATPGVCQVGVRLFIVSLKSKSNLTEVQASAAPLNQLLKKGGTNVGFTGLISDLQAPVNTDLWTLHHSKVFYLSQSYNNYATQVGYWETDISNQIRFFKHSLKVKSKTFNYDDGTSSSLQPTNYAPVMLLGYSYLNGQTPDAVAANCGLFYNSILTYEDM